MGQQKVGWTASAQGLSALQSSAGLAGDLLRPLTHMAARYASCELGVLGTAKQCPPLRLGRFMLWDHLLDWLLQGQAPKGTKVKMHYTYSDPHVSH